MNKSMYLNDMKDRNGTNSSLQQPKTEAIAEWKTVIAEKSQKLVRLLFCVHVQTTRSVSLVDLSRAFFDWPDPAEGEHQQPEGGHQQSQVPDRGISRRAEEPVGEDEEEHQDQQDVHCESGEAAETVGRAASLVSDQLELGSFFCVCVCFRRKRTTAWWSCRIWCRAWLTPRPRSNT